MFRSNFSWSYLIFFLLFGLILVGLFWLRVNLRVEYEYCFTNGELDVDKVTNNTKRKALLSIDIKKIDYLAPIEDAQYSEYDSDPAVKRIYAVLNRERQTYFMVWQDEKEDRKEKKMLLFEPTNEMVRMMKLYNASKVVVAEQTEE